MSDERNLPFFGYINVSVRSKDTDAENMNEKIKLYSIANDKKNVSYR